MSLTLLGVCILAYYIISLIYIGITTYEMEQSSLLVGTGIACMVLAIVITASLLCVGSSNLTDTDWWSLDESQTLHRNASLPLLLRCSTI